MEKKVRFAILGTSSRWKELAPTYFQHPQAELVAVCDKAEGKAQEVAQKHKEAFGTDVKVFRSYEEMKRDAVYDAVCITCDPDIQVEYACAEMERGIHVMTEVPAAYTIEQCWDLVHTVEKTGCKYQLAEQTRYWHFITRWRDMAKAGELGKIYYAEGEYLHYEPKWDYFRNKKTGVSVWTDDPSYDNNEDYERSWRYHTFANPIYYLPHELSPLLSITGGRIERVSCMGTRKGSYATEGFDVRDLECAIMHNSNDVIFNLRAGFTAPYGPKAGTGAHWYQLKGSKKSVEWCRSTIDEPKLYDAKEGWSAHPEWTLEDPDAPKEFRSATHGGADYYPMYYFMRSILEDSIPPMNVYKAVESAAPAILAAESAKRGGELLPVPDFRQDKEEL